VRIESVAFSLDGTIYLGRRWLDCELALILLPWEWEIFRRRELGRLEVCLGPFYVDVYWGTRRIYINSEEDEEDIADVIEALKDYRAGEGISVLEVHERMKREGKVPSDSYIAFEN